MRPSTLTGSRFFARASGAAVILIGGLVLMGWLFDIDTLKSIIPGMVAMNPGGTAVAFLLAGVSLWIQSAPASRRLRAVAMVVRRLASSCGLCSGSAAICWPGMGAGPVLVPRASWPWRTGAPAIPTGWRPTRRRPSCSSAWPCCSWTRGPGAASWPASSPPWRPRLIALLAIIGYAYSALPLAGIEQFIPMALNTAVAFGLISGGILCARPTAG